MIRGLNFTSLKYMFQYHFGEPDVIFLVINKLKCKIINILNDKSSLVDKKNYRDSFKKLNFIN